MEFNRAKSAKEKRAISQGMKKFWDEKGRSIVKVGAAAGGAAGALLLAGKSGKLPKGFGKGVKNVRNHGVNSVKTNMKRRRLLTEAGPSRSQLKSANPMSIRNASRNIVKQSRELGYKGKNLLNAVIRSGQKTRSGFDEGYATADTSKAKAAGGFLGKQAGRAYGKVMNKMRKNMGY